MEIIESDFKLVNNEDRFDLYLVKVINAKDVSKRREEFVLIGYDMHLETCLNKIINYRINKKYDVLSLKEYLNLYRNERKELSALLQR